MSVATLVRSRTLAGKCVSGCTDPTIFEVKSHHTHAVNRGNCNMNNAMYLTGENGDHVQSTCPDDEPTPNLVRALSATRQQLCAGCGRESQQLGRAVRSRELWHDVTSLGIGLGLEQHRAGKPPQDTIQESGQVRRGVWRQPGSDFVWEQLRI